LRKELNAVSGFNSAWAGCGANNPGDIDSADIQRKGGSISKPHPHPGRLDPGL